ncbi:hypothetical protein SKAU_G00379610 [Synaphobranchus kaupii]|uniref:Uncharacterized protein n=1 Tax=Synaphobranchus kaupii TaxID=118154 RepID=A0A9Q1EDD9_SYNKA|nr:hypothetical protein SKAU_G00379610 [Synaphobranchus kaupii]
MPCTLHSGGISRDFGYQGEHVVDMILVTTSCCERESGVEGENIRLDTPELQCRYTEDQCFRRTHSRH